jgi:3-methylcrotonyl-CoA carboxylase alpha subunit
VSCVCNLFHPISFLKGMRIVEKPDEFVDSVLSAQREAASLFGVNTLLIEKYITQPRHVEVEVRLD